MATEFVPGLEGIPIAESAISFVDGENGLLEYRGIHIADLAEHCTFEEVSYLLLQGRLPSSKELADFTSKLAAARPLDDRVLDVIRQLPASGHPMDALQASVSTAGMCEPRRDAGDFETDYGTCVRLIALLPTMVAAFARVRAGQQPLLPDPDLSHAANFLYMLSGQRPHDSASRIMDTCLILHADHTMNASTFTARVVGSTLASPFAVVGAAIGALSGHLHGGANERVLRMLKDISGLDRVEATINAKMDAKEKIMGFGHRVYKTSDPRATVLRGLADQLLHDTHSDILQVARRVEEVVTGRLGTKGIYANVDFYSGLVYDNLGLETELFTPVFAVARVSGWLAHWLEQLPNNRIFRPRQIYTGAHDVAIRRE